MSEVVVPILTTLLAAIIGSYLTLLKFKREKLWQEKYTAYRDLIVAVENIRFWGNEINCSCFFMPTTGFPDNKTPREYLSDSLRKVDHYSTAGSLLFSESFCTLVTEFRQKVYTESYEASEEYTALSEQERELFTANYAATIRDIADEYIPRFIKAAKKEL